MIFYNEINTRVEKFSQIIKDDWYVCKIPMFKFIRIKKKKALTSAYNIIMNKEGEEKSLNDDYYTMSLYVRILLFETLLRSLLFEPNEESRELFKQHFHRDYVGELSNKIIKSKIDRLKVQYAVVQSDQSKEPFDFDVFIRNISTILKADISRVFIYQLPMEVNKAMEIIEQESNQNNQA